MWMNCKRGMYLPITTRQTVIGVASSRPSGPHSHVQQSAETTIATCDTPALLPDRHGSSTLLLTSSSSTKNPITSSVNVQPSNTATAISTGIAAAIQGPTYGTKRSIAD